MKAALNLVYWEIIKKNNVVFPTLGVLLLLGAAMAGVCSSLDPNSALVLQARRLALLSFLISLLIAFTPFMLTENGGGWRMNSMITRWFTLPVSTSLLVCVPLVAAVLFLCTVVALWAVVLHFVVPGLDAVYLAGVLVAAQVLFTAVAWTVPRKPLQFWGAVAVAFPAILILALVPQDIPGNERFRMGMLIPLSMLCVCLLAYTAVAAKMNRRGSWPGEIPIWRPRILDRLHRASQESGRSFWSSKSALAALGSTPTLRLLAYGWGTVVLAIYVYVSIVVRDKQPELAFSWRVLAMVGMGMLPVLAVPILALWGLFAGGEPASAFQTRLSAFKATLPVNSGRIAGDKLRMLFFGWLIVWLPLLVLTLFYTPAILGIETDTRPVLQQFLARLMAVTAFILAGALPVLLYGRLEGFPNVLLAGVCSWVVTWGVTSLFPATPETITRTMWLLMIAALVGKLGLATFAFTRALQAGHATWKFVAFTVVIWLATCAFLSFLLPVYKLGGLWAAGCMAVLLPLARPALCPLAVAANRHR